jgi:hypothetical protein
MIARHSPRSLNLLTNEIARRLEGKAARRDGGSGPGGKLSLFLGARSTDEGGMSGLDISQPTQKEKPRRDCARTGVPGREDRLAGGQPPILSE